MLGPHGAPEAAGPESADPLTSISTILRGPVSKWTVQNKYIEVSDEGHYQVDKTTYASMGYLSITIRPMTCR
jgi:hypothetical protein